MNMNALRTGMTVDIKRTDGRVHEAVISGLNEHTRSVTVEWFEKGETKGKEIELAAIMAINPTLGDDLDDFSERDRRNKGASLGGANSEREQPLPTAAAAHSSPRHSVVLPPSAVQPQLNRKTKLKSAAALLQPEPDRPTSYRHPSRSRSPSLTPSASEEEEEELVIGDNNNIINKTIVSPKYTRSQPKRRAAPAPMTRSVNGAIGAATGVGRNKKPAASGSSRLPAPSSSRGPESTRTLVDENTAPLRSNATVSNNNNINPKRKSVTVQEIDRLKKNREERRAQQEELRRQKEELKNIDPGNPNWEFLGMIRDYCSQLDIRPLRANDAVVDKRISVCVRKRPLSKKEAARKDIEVVTVPNKDHVIVHQPQTKVDLTKYLDNQKYRFDYLFNETVGNEMVYKFTAQPLVRTIFDEGFATCFAYGQTGSGKTHTMGGDFHGKEQDCARGIYAMTARDVFKHMEKKDYKRELYVTCTFFEIYSGKVFDLLNDKAKLRVLEDGRKEVQIVGLTEKQVANENDVLKLIARGTDVRTAGQTSANNHSSRSHAVFQILLRRKNNQKLFGKFSLIDLAGNERGVDTMSSDRQTRMEGAEINKSLLGLKECIRAMAHNNPHLPFRASKLTLVLRDSFVGSNSRTCMIAMISPGMSCVENTLNTLRYADRVKELRSDDDGLYNGGDRDEGSSNGHDDYELADDDNDSDTDLALVQSRNADALSDDLYHYQLAMNHVQDAEDQALEEHQRYLEAIEKMSKRLARLLKSTEKVDYDIDAYAREAAEIMANIPSNKQFADSIAHLRAEIQKEDEMRQKSQGKRTK